LSEKEKEPAKGSFEETARWQLLEFANSTVGEKLDFLGMMYKAMISAKKTRE